MSDRELRRLASHAMALTAFSLVFGIASLAFALAAVTAGENFLAALAGICAVILGWRAKAGWAVYTSITE